MWVDWKVNEITDSQIDWHESQLFPVRSSSVLAPRMNDANGSLGCYYRPNRNSCNTSTRSNNFQL